MVSPHRSVDARRRTARSHSRKSAIPAVRLALLMGMLFVIGGLTSVAEARTRSFCAGAVSRSCGGHLEPVCTSGSQCDDGHSVYSGSPFPITIDCPSIIPNTTVTSGCYDERPDCGDCSASGQIPCPAESEPWCTSGCDAGLAPDPVTGLCRTPRGPGDACGPAAPCGSGLVCDPLAGFVCVSQAGANESCADPFVSCQEGLQCTLALQCSHEPARLGETCDATAPCGELLFCKAGIPQRCDLRRGLGDACGPGAQCLEGLQCDPLAGFVCVEPAGPDDACLTRSCREDLVCTAQLRCSHQPGLDGESCDLVNRCAEGHFCDGITNGIAGAIFGTCRAYTKPGEACFPNPSGLDDCVPGTSCQLFVEDDSASTRCAVAGSSNPIPPAACRAFYSPAMRAEAIAADLTLTVGSGVETAAGGGRSTEVGVTYGEDGRYGCHFSECSGANLDLGIEAFTVLGFYDAFTSVPGFSFVSFQEAQIAGVLNFATMQIFARANATDPTPGAFIGTADALSLGTPTNPFPVAGGAVLCSTNLREIDLVTYESGLVAPRYIPEPSALALSLAALATLVAILRLRTARRDRTIEGS